MSNYCSQFPGVPCTEPEPFASLTDVITAAQLVENAIHAADIASATNYLNSAMLWLQHAYDYFGTANCQLLQQQTMQAMNTLRGVITNLQSTTQLKTFQANTIYGYMGILSALYNQLKGNSINYSSC
jgi:hypothetical protein